MIKLSDRLQLIADLIETGQTVADIGTDHGFLPVFLRESGKSPKVILADISKGSLQKAIDNVQSREYDSEEMKASFDFRLGDGIAILGNGEVDAVVIAGMGGVLMTEILGENLQKTKSFQKIILQPRNGQGKLRRWLLQNGFEIVSENLVKEGKFICEILEISPVNNQFGEIKLPSTDKNPLNSDSEDIQYEIPASLIISNGSLGMEFARKKLQIEKNILSNMNKATALHGEEKKKQAERIQYLENIMKEGEK